MRILLVANVLGDESIDVWREVASRDIKLTILGSRTTYGGEIYAPTSPVEDVKLDMIAAKPHGLLTRGHLWWWYPELRPTIRRVSPELIHVLSEPWGTLVQQALILAPQIPVVAHGSTTTYSGGPLPRRLLRTACRRMAFWRLAGFAAATRRALDAAHAHGLSDSTPTAIAQHLVPAQWRFRECDSTYRTPDTGSLAFTFVGRVTWEKGLDVLLDATSGVSGVAVTVVGDGPDRASLKGRSQLRQQRVRWLGLLSPSQTLRHLTNTDVVVVPSRRTPTWEEYFGRVALEAMHCGRPLIVSDSGNLPALVGDAGIVVPAGDTNALRDAVVMLRGDPELRETLSSRARNRAQCFLPNYVADEIISLWTEVLRGSTQ